MTDMKYMMEITMTEVIGLIQVLMGNIEYMPEKNRVAFIKKMMKVVPEKDLKELVKMTKGREMK